MTENGAIVALQDVSKTFGTAGRAVHAARSVSLALTGGRTLALVGESGSGKTTCARLIMREYAPDSGALLFRGQPLDARSGRDMSAYRQAVQMIFQDPFASLNPAHTVGYHLARPLSLYGRAAGRSARTAAIGRLLEQVRLDPGIVDRFPHELSGGQRQRVAIARALAVGPEVLVADEPTSMLDVSVRLGILNLLNDMKRTLGLAVLYITHDIATARYVAEDIMVMYAGHVVEWGPTESVLANPHHPYTRLLLSAVPDPDRPYREAAGGEELLDIELIRRQSAEPQSLVEEVLPGHFIRPVSRNIGPG